MSLCQAFNVRVPILALDPKVPVDSGRPAAAFRRLYEGRRNDPCARARLREAPSRGGVPPGVPARKAPNRFRLGGSAAN